MMDWLIDIFFFLMYKNMNNLPHNKLWTFSIDFEEEDDERERERESALYIREDLKTKKK